MSQIITYEYNIGLLNNRPTQSSYSGSEAYLGRKGLEAATPSSPQPISGKIDARERPEVVTLYSLVSKRRVRPTQEFLDSY